MNKDPVRETSYDDTAPKAATAPGSADTSVVEPDPTEPAVEPTRAQAAGSTPGTDPEPQQGLHATPEDSTRPEIRESIIQCHGLTKMHRQVIAVNDLTVDISPGITGLLGPNGAGKSTFMRMIMGLQKPSSGSLRVYGAQPWDNHTLLKRLGFVPEGDAPWQEDNAIDVAERVALLSGLEDDAARDAAERHIAQVGLSKDAERPVETFSKGMRQRLKFALALLHDPDLLILDEPLLGADPLTRRDLIEIIRAHAARGGSVLVSSHILSDVEALTEQILVIDSGRRRAYGSIAEIRDWLEQYPRTIRVGTPEPRAMASELSTWDSVVSVEAEEHGIVIRTDAAQTFYQELQSYLTGGEVPFDAIQALDEDIESVFGYLIGGER